MIPYTERFRSSTKITNIPINMKIVPSHHSFRKHKLNNHVLSLKKNLFSKLVNYLIIKLNLVGVYS